MLHRSLLTCLSLLCCGTLARAADAPDDCSLEFNGQARKAVKLRTEADGTGYETRNGGQPITVSEWFHWVCSGSLNHQVPDSGDIPGDAAMDGIETTRVKLRGYLLAAKFESGTADHDIHAEIGESADWESPHVVVEVPPGPDYCEQRKALWKIVRDDMNAAGVHRSQWILENPVKVEFEGYLFLDVVEPYHICKNPGGWNWCDRNGGRGLHKDHGDSQVRGCWELHPVLAVRRVDAD